MLRTELFYYFILFVYVSLWSCQLVACHLTHSLIILTESYINLYRILDISLGILHLRTQSALAEHREKSHQPGGQKTDANDDKKQSKSSHELSLAEKLFSCACTYQYKRLPLLGSFVNGLFLAALLMSAAIEGIQTCFHSGHSLGHDQKTILNENALTYPIILVGFAVVGLIMQFCSMKAHEMREEELCSNSLLDLQMLNEAANSAQSMGACDGQTVIAIRELNVNNLIERQNHQRRKNSSKRQSYDLNLNSHSSETGLARPTGGGSQLSLQELPLTIRSNEIAHDNDENRISLKSLRFSVNLESLSPIESISRGLGGSSLCENEDQSSIKRKQAKAGDNRDKWFLVRYFTSPVALITCASIIYFANDEMATEIADAMLAVTVVVILFASSYPPMKRAGKILLQTAPDGVDLSKLERDLRRSSDLILAVRDLHVWSLTPRSNRVATCSLELDKEQIKSEQQIRDIISEAKYRFLDQNIKCTTIEPMFKSQTVPDAKSVA